MKKNPPEVTQAVTENTLVPTAGESEPIITQTQRETGTIEGSLSYPSEAFPDNMSVCAESDELENPICTKTFINDKKYQYGRGYTLAVPAGTYLVYAKLDSAEYRAYYNKFVTCGLLASCEDHTPIQVTVKANQTISKVDPQDWYNVQPSL